MRRIPYTNPNVKLVLWRLHKKRPDLFRGLKKDVDDESARTEATTSVECNEQ
jgi:hypothetical protein